MTAHETRLADLHAKLAARMGKPGMEENVKALKAEIARLGQVGADNDA